ncbi:MAG: GntR family transcriptional regulator [Planctomycetota bacterium]|nr:GntR family transcriptional regulator [Planctomycetota bacterium]
MATINRLSESVPGAFSIMVTSTSSTESSADVAYRKLRQMLCRGELVPGQRLSQSRLGRQLGCSSMPVVEAMRRLESEGVLLKQARKQAIVRKLSEKDLEGLYLLRDAIESVAARLAALRATPEETRVLEKLAEAFEGNVEANHDSGDADLAIHRHIAASARCPLLNEELDRLLLIERTAGRSFDSETEQICHPHCHRALVQAIVDHDADSAEYLMKKHIQSGYAEVQRILATHRIKPCRTRRASQSRNET